MLKRVHHPGEMEGGRGNRLEEGSERAMGRGVKGGASVRDGVGTSLKRIRGQSISNGSDIKGETPSVGLKVHKRARIVKGLGC